METKTLTVLTEEQFVEKQTKLYCDMLYRAMARWQNTQAKKIPNAITWETKYIYETGRKYFKVIKVEEPFTSKNSVKHQKHTCVEAFIDSEKGNTFRSTFNRAQKGSSQLIQIATWNDFGEGTNIVQEGQYALLKISEFNISRKLPIFRYLS